MLSLLLISLLGLLLARSTRSGRLEEERRRRYAVVNLPIELFSFSTVLDEQSLGDVATACEVFVQGKLGTAPSANVSQVSVAIGPQSLNRGGGGGDGFQPSTSTATDDDGPSWPLLLHLNILIEFYVEEDVMDTIDFEEQVIEYFENEWTDVMSFLRLLDSAAETNRFESVDRIEVPRELLKGKMSTTPNEHDSIYQVPILVYVILGISIIFLLTTSMPLVCLFRKHKKRNRNASLETDGEDSALEAGSRRGRGDKRDSTDRTDNASDQDALRRSKEEEGDRPEVAAAASEAETVHARNAGCWAIGFQPFYIPIAASRPPPSVSTISGTNSVYNSNMNVPFDVDASVSSDAHNQGDEDFDGNGDVVDDDDEDDDDDDDRDDDDDGDDDGGKAQVDDDGCGEGRSNVTSQPSQLMDADEEMDVDIVHSTDSEDEQLGSISKSSRSF